MAATLPAIVLISPLCASTENGCARAHDGDVFVAKRWWKTATRASNAASARSG
jgi:hypothetical protein